MLGTSILILLVLSCIQGANSSCAVGQYSCKNILPESCINSTLVGDGHADCADNSDEVQVTCAKQSSFVCSSGACIPLTYRFDNTTDCPYGIDEVKYLGDWCDPAHTTFSCSRYTNNSQCVNSSCTCQPGWTQTDYQTCHRESSSCTVGYYGCKNIFPEACINSTLVGDGHADCADNSDEVQVTCAKINQFVCTTGTCIPLTYRFDNNADCPDGVDEVKYLGDWCDPAHTTFSCSRYTNNSQCVNSSCTCQPGWTQADYQTCHRGEEATSFATPDGYVVSNNGSQYTTLNPITAGFMAFTVELGDSCIRDLDCSGAVNNSECRNTLCMCIHGYVEEQNRTECRLQNLSGVGNADYTKMSGPSPAVTGAIIAVTMIIASAAIVGIVGTVLYIKRPKPPKRSPSMYKREDTTITVLYIQRPKLPRGSPSMYRREDTTISRRSLSLRQMHEQFGITFEHCPPSVPPVRVSYPVIGIT